MDVKRGRFKTTFERRGMADRRNDAARDTGNVSGLTNDVGSVDAAIDGVRSALGPNHPNISDLPLHTVTARKWSPTQASFVAEYRHGPTSKPTRPAGDMLRRNPATIQMQWWSRETAHDGTPLFDDKGLPSGSIEYVTTIKYANAQGISEVNLKFKPYVRRIPVQRITIPTVLEEDPTEAVVQFMGKTNEGEYTIGPHTFADNTLRFDATQVQPHDTYYGLRYVVGYVFLHRPETWVRQRTLAVIEWDAWTTFSFPVVEVVAQYPQVTFPELPVHA
jgi:hypothetical protein